jgi:glutamyl-tRNA synthetase
LRNPGGAKISKRKNPVSLNYYRDAGFLSEAMLNYLARMGWSMPDEREKFNLEEMIENFTFDRISLGGPVFDVAKLTWLNGLWLREQPVDRLVRRLQEDLFSHDRLAAIAPLLQERIDKLEDFVGKADFFFAGEVDYDDEARAALVPKKREAREVAQALSRVLEQIDLMPRLEASILEEALRGLCDELGFKPRDLFMPVRVAITGRKATPGLFETMVVLGKERCRRRLRAAITLLRGG